MLSINGIGTSLYGKNEVESDGSYVATKWVIFIFLPIVPIGSYRVRRGKTESTMTAIIGLPGAETKYEMVRVPINWKQVFQIYLAVYGTVALLILDFIFDPKLYFGKALLVGIFVYSLYCLFKNGKKWWAIFLIFSILVLGLSIFIN